jgi:hypothetical protein
VRARKTGRNRSGSVTTISRNDGNFDVKSGSYMRVKSIEPVNWYRAVFFQDLGTPPSILYAFLKQTELYPAGE